MVNYYEFLGLEKDDLITDEIVKEKIKEKEVELWKAKTSIGRQLMQTSNDEIKVKELKEERKLIDEQVKILSKVNDVIGTENARNNYNKLLEEIDKDIENTEVVSKEEKNTEDVYSTENVRAKSEKFMELVRRFKENSKNRGEQINEIRQENQMNNLTIEQLKSLHNENHAKRIAELDKEQEELTRIKYGMDLDEKKLSKLAKIINDGKKDLKDREEKFKMQKQNNEREIGDE